MTPDCITNREDVLLSLMEQILKICPTFEDLCLMHFESKMGSWF